MKGNRVEAMIIHTSARSRGRESNVAMPTHRALFILCRLRSVDIGLKGRRGTERPFHWGDGPAPSDGEVTEDRTGLVRTEEGVISLVHYRSKTPPEKDGHGRTENRSRTTRLIRTILALKSP